VVFVEWSLWTELCIVLSDLCAAVSDVEWSLWSGLCGRSFVD